MEEEQKNLGGRPTKYEEEEAIKKLEEYITTGFLRDGDVIPTIEGLSEHLEVACSTIHLWSNKHDKFSEALERLLKKQSRLLQNMGLLGTFNSTITKLMLSSNHGMNEKSIQDNTSSDGSMKPTVIQLVGKDVESQD